MEQPFQPHALRRSSHLQSGASTPLGGNGLTTPNRPFGSPPIDIDPYPFFSAPTSQHPSRAPSPNSSRINGGNYQAQHVPQQAAYALASLPPGLNLQRPPIIQRLIPNAGPRSGGDEVTVLGSGFFQGLDVMFGDNVATNTTFWGDTTLVCRAPPSASTGPVAVVFKHQHHTAPRVLQEVQALLPTRLVAYNYYDDDKTQMQGLALGVSAQLHGMNGNKITQEEMARNFYPNQARAPKFNRTNSSSRLTHRNQVFTETPEDVSDEIFEASLMKWLDTLDMADSPFEPCYNLRNEKGSTLLMLASGRGYDRFTAGLLARGVSSDLRNKSGFTALMIASLHGHTNMVRRLLLKGADSGIRTLHGQTAADLAASSEVSHLLTQIDFLSNYMHKSMKVTKSYRRPSSTLSVESLSGISASSQPSHPDADESLTDISSEPPAQLLTKVWSSKDIQIPGEATANCPSLHDVPALLQAGAALLAWREQIVSQMHQFHQAMVDNVQNIQFPGISPTSYLQMPAINMPDYRRLAELIMAPSITASPPAYSDIYPSGQGSKEKETRRNLPGSEEIRAEQSMSINAKDTVNDLSTDSTMKMAAVYSSPKSKPGIVASFSRPLLFPWVRQLDTLRDPLS